MIYRAVGEREKMSANSEAIRRELVDQGVLTSEQFTHALLQRERAGGTLVEHLVGLGVDANQLVLPMCSAAGMLPASASRVRQPDPGASSGIPAAVLSRYALVPFGRAADGTLSIAYADPLVAEAPELSGLPPHKKMLASLTDVRAGLDVILNVDEASTVAMTGVAPAPVSMASPQPAPSLPPPGIFDEPTRAVNTPTSLLRGAINSAESAPTSVFTGTFPTPTRTPAGQPVATAVAAPFDKDPSLPPDVDTESGLGRTAAPAAMLSREAPFTPPGATPRPVVGASNGGDWAGQAAWADGTSAGIAGTPEGSNPFAQRPTPQNKNPSRSSPGNPSAGISSPGISSPGIASPGLAAQGPISSPPSQPLPTGLTSKEMKNLQPGMRVGEFKVLRRLGVGGMAAVYLAEYRGEQVALKLMMPHLAEDPTFIGRFQREIAACEALSHPNVVGIKGHGEFEGLAHFLIGEFVDGGTVLGLRRALGQVPAVLTARIIADVLAGLGYAHDKGVIHRDIKPANLLMSSGGLVKLADFGIAKQQTDSALTATGMLVGTPSYMSPEQALGMQIDHRCDLYAVGIVAYELLTGGNPYMHENPAVVIMRVSEGAAPPIFQAAPTVPGLLERVVNKLLAHNRDERYSHAQEAIDDLAPLLAMGEQIEHNLIGAAIRDPEGLKARCVSAMCEAEQQRADTLIRAGADKNAAAASIALYRACLLNPDSEVARRRFQEVCAQHQLDYGSLEKDPRFAEVAAEMQSQRTPAPGLLKRAAELARANNNPFLHAVYLKQYLRKKPNDSVASQQLQVLLGWSEDALKDPTSTAASIVGLSHLNTQQLMDGLRTGGFKASDRAGEQAAKLQSASANMVVSHQVAQKRMADEQASGPAASRPMSHVDYADPGLAEMLQSWVKPAIGLSIALLLIGGGFKLVGSFITDTRDSISQGIEVQAQKASQNEDKRGMTELERQQADKLRRGKVRADLKDWRNATMLFDAALAIDPRSPQGIEALLERGRVHMQSGNLVQARKDFDLVITRAGDDAILSQEARAELLKLAAEQERPEHQQAGPATGKTYNPVPSDAVR